VPFSRVQTCKHCLARRRTQPLLQSQSARDGTVAAHPDRFTTAAVSQNRSLFAARNRLPVDLAAARCRRECCIGASSLGFCRLHSNAVPGGHGWARHLLHALPLTGCLSLWTLYFSLQPASHQASPSNEAFARFRCIQLSCHSPPIAKAGLDLLCDHRRSQIDPLYSKLCPISPGCRFAISHHRPFLRLCASR